MFASEEMLRKVDERMNAFDDRFKETDRYSEDAEVVEVIARLFISMVDELERYLVERGY